jgi:hypothetical protein
LSAQPVTTPFSTQSLADTVDMSVTGDVFTHTWDMARATGQDEALDPDQQAGQAERRQRRLWAEAVKPFLNRASQFESCPASHVMSQDIPDGANLR